jgi:inorganic pyrophosphatase
LITEKHERRVTGIIVTVDLNKRDAEFKLLLGCSAEEAQIAIAMHNRGSQAGKLVERRDTGESTIHD